MAHSQTTTTTAYQPRRRTDRHSRGKHFHTQLKLSMSVLREYTTAAFFTYFSKVHLTDILRINWHFRQQFYYYF